MCSFPSFFLCDVRIRIMFGQTLVAARSVRATVSVSAKPSKAGDFRSMTIEAIDAEVTNCKRELLTLRIKQRTRQVRVGSLVNSIRTENISSLLDKM